MTVACASPSRTTASASIPRRPRRARASRTSATALPPSAAACASTRVPVGAPASRAISPPPRPRTDSSLPDDARRPRNGSHVRMPGLRSTLLCVTVLAVACPAAGAAVDYGPISHKGMKTVGRASTSLKLGLQLGFVANQSGLQGAVKAASNPASSSYGRYPSLSTLQSKYGASSSKRKGVVNAFKSNGVTAKLDVTHLRASATVSVGKAQKMFGTKWKVYRTSSGSKVALPVNTPKLPKGIKGNVDTIAGMRVQLSGGSSSAVTAQAPADGGTPTRTGTPAFGCVPASFPAALASDTGLYPNQILTAYGIAPLQAAGLKGQGARLAIVGEGPTPASDVNAFRSCFGTQGTALKIHNAGSIKPILESSLDAMVASTVAPALSRFDLWVHPISENDDDGDVEGFLQLLAQPLQATSNGVPLPHVISVSYGECESVVKPYTAACAPAHRHRGARHHHRGRRGRHGLLGLRARRPREPAHIRRQEAAGVLAGLVPVGAGGGRDESHARRRQRDRLDRRLERHRLPGAVREHGGRRGRLERLRIAALVAARPVLRQLRQAHGARRRRLRRPPPRLPDRLLQRGPELQGLGPEHRLRGRHVRGGAARRRHGRAVESAGAHPGPATARLRPAAAVPARAAPAVGVRRRHAGRQRALRRLLLSRARRLRHGDGLGLAI